MSVIDEVKQRTDIVQVIGQYVTLTKSGKNLRGLCPFHSEKHASFFVYPEQQSWHCFGACGTGGDAFSFVMKKEGIGFGDALRLLAQKAGVTIPSRFDRDEGKEEKEELYQINEAAALYFHNLLLNSPAGEKARNYAEDRGFLTKTIADFQLGFSLESWEALKQYLLEKGYQENALQQSGLVVAADNDRTHDRFRGRLMFPIRDARGRTIGFGARALDDSMPKYINSSQSPLFDKGNNLYGIDLAAPAIRKQDLAIIVEGYMDVITAHQNGFNNVVASMGTAITETQVSTLKKLTRNLTLALDADTAGEEAMLRVVGYENILDAEIKVIILPAGKDPDDVIKEDAAKWQQLTEEALPIIDYTFGKVTTGLDLTTAGGKSLAIEKLLPTVAEINKIERQAHYIKELAYLVKTSEHTLESAINRMKSGPIKKRVQEPRQQVIARTSRQTGAAPLEEYCLALLLQHPEFKDIFEAFPPEYLEKSENREIYTIWQQVDDLTSLKEELDTAMYEYLDLLTGKDIPSNQIEQRCTSCILRLKERHLKNLEAKRAEIFALEAESGGAGADLTKLEEEGMEPSIQLGEVFIQKRRKWPELRR